MNIQKKLENYLDKPIAQAADKEIYGGLLTIVQEMASVKERFRPQIFFLLYRPELR